MNLKSLVKPWAVGLVAVVVTGLGVATASPALAATGTLTVAPATGLNTTGITVGTSAACTGGTNLQVSVNGSGITNQSVTQNYVLTALPSNPAGGYDIPLGNTMLFYANQQVPVATLSGEYVFTAICKNGVGAAVFDTFTGSIWFTSSTVYQNTNPTTPTVTATTTALSTSVPSPQTVGTSVTLNAAVSPAAAAGSVQFMDGTTALGSPVAVSAGTASLATTALAVGTHPLTAVFTPTTATAFAASTSTATSYVINAVVPTATATTPGLSASSSAVTTGTSVTFTATVAPATAAGSVVFADGGATLSTVAVATGSAAFSTTTLAAGTHSVTASFVPTSPAAFAPSASAAVSVSVTAPGALTGSQTITTSVAAGSLAITQLGTSVNLPALSLDTTGKLLTTTGAINNVTVTDTRAATPGFSVTGQVTDFASGANAINGYNLGWTPGVVSSFGTTAVKGPDVAAGQGLAVAATPANATDGLKSVRTLGTGAGMGTSVFSAGLSLTAPTSTQAGTYSATLTITAI